MVVKARKQLPAPAVMKPVQVLDSKSPLDTEQVERSISALLQLCKKQHETSKKKSLFNDDPQPISLQLTSMKIPVTETQQIRIALPHPVIGENADVCLITKDVKFATKIDTERSLLHFQKLLEEKKVEGISQVIPLRQLINETKPYEAKGRIARIYDAYLIDGQDLGLVSNILGSRFFRTGKTLIPVNMTAKNLKMEVKKALSKTVMKVHGKGDTFTVTVAHTNFSEQQIKENILVVVEALGSGMFPGGFPNIRKLHVKTARSLAIPIYISLAFPDTVEVPVVKPKLPKLYKPMAGELSTFLNRNVTVYPDGKVVVEAGNDDDEEDSEGEASEGEEPTEYLGEVDEEREVDVKKRKIKDDEDESDDEVEAAEDAYLSELQLDVTDDHQPKQPAAKKKEKKGKINVGSNQPIPKKQKLATPVPVKPEVKVPVKPDDKVPVKQDKKDKKDNSEAKRKKQEKMESKKHARKQRRDSAKEAKKLVAEKVLAKKLDVSEVVKSPVEATEKKVTGKDKSKHSFFGDQQAVTDAAVVVALKSSLKVKKIKENQEKKMKVEKNRLPLSKPAAKPNVAATSKDSHEEKVTHTVREKDPENQTEKNGERKAQKLLSKAKKEKSKLIEVLLKKAKQEIATPKPDQRSDVVPPTFIIADNTVIGKSSKDDIEAERKSKKRMLESSIATSPLPKSKMSATPVSPPLKQSKIKAKQEIAEKLSKKKVKAATVKSLGNGSTNGKSPSPEKKKKKKVKKVK